MKRIKYRGQGFELERRGTTYRGMSEYRVVHLHQNGVLVAKGVGVTFDAATRDALYHLFPLKRGERVRMVGAFAGRGELATIKRRRPDGRVDLRYDSGHDSILCDPGDYERLNDQSDVSKLLEKR